jgi:hypothetical protein
VKARAQPVRRDVVEIAAAKVRGAQDRHAPGEFVGRSGYLGKN